MHQDQPDAECREQVQVVDEGEEPRALGKELAAEGDNERAAAEGVHVRRHLAQPADECFGMLRRSHCIFFKLYGLIRSAMGAVCFASGGSKQ